MWRAGDFEVIYTPIEGIVGISTFTVGELYDKRATFAGRKTTRAFSYSRSKDELVIVTTFDGYQLSVE